MGAVQAARMIKIVILRSNAVPHCSMGIRFISPVPICDTGQGIFFLKK